MGIPRALDEVMLRELMDSGAWYPLETGLWEVEKHSLKHWSPSCMKFWVF